MLRNGCPRLCCATSHMATPGINVTDLLHGVLRHWLSPTATSICLRPLSPCPHLSCCLETGCAFGTRQRPTPSVQVSITRWVTKVGVSFAAEPVVHPSGEICAQFTHLVWFSLVVSEEKLCESAPKIVDPGSRQETARGCALVLGPRRQQSLFNDLFPFSASLEEATMTI